MPGFYRALAALVLLLHAAYIASVIFGALFTRGRARLAALHVGMLLYGIIVEILGLWCPLTELEQWIEIRGGVSPIADPSFSFCTILTPSCTPIFPQSF